MEFNDKNSDYYLNNCYFYKNTVDIDNMKIDNTYTFLSDVRVSDKIIANHNLIVMGNIKAREIDINGDLICFKNIQSEELKVEGKLICFGELSTGYALLGDNSYIDRGDVLDLTSNTNIYVNEIFQINDNAKVNNAIFMDGVFGDGTLSGNNIIVDNFCDIENINYSNEYIVLNDNKPKDNKVKDYEEKVSKSLNNDMDTRKINIFNGEIQEVTDKVLIIKSDIGKCIIKAKDSLTSLDSYKNRKTIKFSVKDINYIGTTDIIECTRKDIFINKLFYDEINNYNIKSIFIKKVSIEDTIEIRVFLPAYNDEIIKNLKEIEYKISIELGREVNIKIV